MMNQVHFASLEDEDDDMLEDEDDDMYGGFNDFTATDMTQVGYQISCSSSSSSSNTVSSRHSRSANQNQLTVPGVGGLHSTIGLSLLWA